MSGIGKDLAEAEAAVTEFAESPEVQAMFRRIAEAHGRLAYSEDWDTMTGRKIENVYGYFKMALEAAGVDM